MALDLLCASIVFKIPHMPNSRLQLRMGIHSGPAIGIVSGSKTPKYWYINKIIQSNPSFEQEFHSI